MHWWRSVASSRGVTAIVVVMLSGTDETINDRVYARHSYMAEEILWNRRFVDVVSVMPSGHRMVDLTQFHDTRDPQDETSGG